MNGHPVAIPEWTPLHKRLPAHTLCLTHVKRPGERRRCLAVPESEAIAYLEQLDRFAAEIEAVAARHHEAELARPKPRGKGPKRVKPAWPASKLHRHHPGSPCLVPVSSTEPGWLECKADLGAYTDGTPIHGGYVHVHRTKRGRPFLVRHIEGDKWCPLTIARRAAEAEAAEAAENEVA